jgi:hypothetical protein
MSESASVHEGIGTGRAPGWPGLARFDRVAWLLLCAAMAAALALILWLGRDTTFSIDELAWFATTPGLDLEDALSPHAGHLILTSRLAYAAIFETLGAGYEPFRLLTGAALLLTVALFFVYASRRVGRTVALAPCLILLVFGSDAVHVLVGNGFTVLLALSCGLGALLALDRGDRRGELAACALLCLGVVTYTVALAFVVGVAVVVLLQDDRWRRIWVAAVPTALYAIWWLWSLGRADSSDDQLSLSNILLIPSWTFHAVDAVLGALSGLDYDFSGEVGSGAPDVGPILALAALVAVGWRLSRGRVPATFWAAIAIALSLWAMQAIAPTVFRTPETARYLFPGAVATLLVLVEAGRGLRWSRGAVVALYAVAVVGVATNLIKLRDEGRELRSTITPSALTDLGALELAGERADPAFQLPETEPRSPLTLSFAAIEEQGEPPLAAYLAAVERYGALGYAPEEIGAQTEVDRVRADALLARALGVGLEPYDGTLQGCRRLEAEPGGVVSLTLPPRGLVLESDQPTAPVEVQRFGTEVAVPLAGLSPGQPALLRIPPDGAAEPWRASVAVESLRACLSG